ncbi:MAG: 3-isopropylmalate dehydratase small subunit [Gemmatimonas sp.]|nr:3-isopropylmalate dehydratase small subunit [Gemmatimonas sp.]
MSTGVTHATSAVRAPWTQVTSAAVLLAHDDIDTDQIIPARFLTTTQRAGLGQYCFNDWRYDESGTPRAAFALNRPENVGHRILVAGANFGCGSSREHAPWALLDAGFEAVVAASFADIFRSNANRNGLLTVAIGEHIGALHEWLRTTPDGLVTIELESQRIAWSTGHSVHFDVDAFTKHGLLTGLDELGMLLAELPIIHTWETANAREGA